MICAGWAPPRKQSKRLIAPTKVLEKQNKRLTSRGELLANDMFLSKPACDRKKRWANRHVKQNMEILVDGLTLCDLCFIVLHSFLGALIGTDVVDFSNSLTTLTDGSCVNRLYDTNPINALIIKGWKITPIILNMFASPPYIGCLLMIPVKNTWLFYCFTKMCL